MAAKASCQVTIADITDAYSVVLTSETYTFMGNTSGAPIGSACTTQAIAYQGDTQCSKVTIGTISCPTGISASVSNNGMASPTITFKTTAVISTACEASVPVIIDGITIYKKFSFAVANQGAGFGWNLVRNSKLSDGTKHIVAEDVTINVVDDSAYGKALSVIPVSGKRIYWNVEKVWVANTTYTVSFIAKASVAGQKIRPSRSCVDYGEDISLSTVYKQYTTQILSTATVDGGTLSFSFSNATGDITITNVKLEKGTKATEWTPHPDDLVGDTGKGIKSTAITYQASTSGTTVPTGTWSGSIPTVSAGQYLWVRTIFSYSDNTTSTIYSVSRMGANGATGTNGKGIGSVVNYYLATASSSGVTAATSGWTTAVQSVSAAKKYLWNYEVVKYTDGTVASTTAPCIIGSYGDQGSKGDKGDTGSTGNGIKGIVEHYAVSSSNSIIPTSWSSTVPTMTESNKYLWNYETITYTNGTTVDTTKRVIGVHGNKGATGATGSQGYSLVANVVRDAFTESLWTTYGTINHEETWSSTSGIRNGCRIGDMFAIVGTATDTKNAHVAYYRSNTASGDLKGLCISHTIIPRGATGATGSKGDKGDTGASGKGVKSTAVTYQASSSGTTIPTGVWSATPPATSADKPYFWTRTIITYTDNTTSTAYNVGSTPEGIVVGGRNLFSNSGNLSKVSVGAYNAGTYSITFSSDNIVPGKSVMAIKWSTVPTNGGLYFSGYNFVNRGIKKGDIVTVTVWQKCSTAKDTGVMNVEFLESESYSYRPKLSTGWQQYVITGKVSKDVVSGTSGIAITFYYGGTIKSGDILYLSSPKVEKGNIATDWTPAPEDYVSFVDVEYYLSTSATSLSGGSWSTTAPTWVNGKYMWSRTVTTDGAGNRTYSPNQNGVCIAGAQGATGAKGDKGDTGETGATGKGVKSIVEQYYKSTSATAMSGGSWSTTYPGWENSKYIWTRSVITYTDNTTSTTTAVCVTGEHGDKGDKGDKGDAGKGVKSTAITYQVSSSGTTVPTGTWSSSVPSASAGQYLWTRTVITYTDNTSSTLYSVGRMGTNGTNGSNGANGKSIGSITNYYLATPSASGVTASTSGWTTSVQSVSASKKYLWNYEVVKYTDGTIASTTAPCIIGSYGDTGAKGDKGATGGTGPTGNGIKSITEHYAVSTSNSSAPTTWSTTVPTMTETNKYLWNYETIIYTNNATNDTAKRVIGVYGNKGATGNAALQVKRNWSGTYVTVGQTTTVATGDFNRTPVAGDVFIALDGSSNTGTWLVTNVSGTTVSIKLLAYVNSKGDAGADGNSVCTLTTNYSYTQAEIDKYSADNYSGIWAVTSTNGARVGDLVFLRVTNKTKNGYSYILAKITSIVSSTSVKCTSTGSIDKGEQGAKGDQGSKGDKGESDIKCYKLRGGSNQVVWSKLGTLVSDGDNSNFVVTIYTGDGYNGNAYQNSKAEIVIKDAWQSSASTTSAFGVSVTRQNCENLKVQVRAIASNKCELWVYLPWTYSWGTYTIAGKYTSWIEGSVTQTTEPTDGTVQKLEYRMNPENAAKTATNWMEFNEGTGLEIGDKSSGSWSGYRTKITSSTFEILNKAGTTLASYGEKLVQLGKNTKDAVIELCGGLGKIRTIIRDSITWLTLESQYIGLQADKQIYLETSDSTHRCAAGMAGGSIDFNANYNGSSNPVTARLSIGNEGNGVITMESVRNGYDCIVGLYAGGWSGGTYTGTFAPSKYYSEKVLLGDNGAGQLWDRLMAKNATQIMSDRRAKYDIKPLGADTESQIATMSLDSEYSNANPVDIHSELFDRLQPVQYRMVNDDRRIRFGFVAQDVMDAMNELGIREDELDLVHHDQRVTENGYNDTYGMVYTNLIALITHELQLEKQRRSNLEIEVADLRSELESMRDNISGDTN